MIGAVPFRAYIPAVMGILIPTVGTLAQREDCLLPKDMLGIPLFLCYPALAFILLGIALIAIPRRGVRRLFPQSLLFGFVLSFVFVVLTRALNLMHYVHYGPFVLLGSPVWLNLAWSPAILVFLYFRPGMDQTFLFWSYILGFSLMSAVLNEALFRLGLLVQDHWSSWARFAVGIGWFYAAALFDERYMRRIQDGQG